MNTSPIRGVLRKLIADHVVRSDPQSRAKTRVVARAYDVSMMTGDRSVRPRSTQEMRAVRGKVEAIFRERNLQTSRGETFVHIVADQAGEKPIGAMLSFDRRKTSLGQQLAKMSETNRG